ncbi:unnamed protein product [Leptidea sinapis]|uniref:dTCF n=1 Tax=Leptidea sinapis TaxID=189913 RepID=A0A5E4PVH2_9NEOP|nr:unnamed protein product [Leptidea sinapis]
MGLPAGGGLSLFCPGGDLGQPPPAHMGIPPPYQLDSKLAAGLARTPIYPFPGGTYPYPMLSPEMSQVAASWHTPSMYPISSAASGFRSPYPTSLPISTSSLSSELYRFSPTLGAGLGLGLGPALVPPPSKTDIFTHHSRSQEKSSGSSDKPSDGTASTNNKDQNKKPHIKKPLNAFMLYMKEMRAKVVAECTLKESAAINQILGRRWHSLSREEQAKYYEKARQERQLHMQLYPGWSARDNYGYGSKKKKRKKDRGPAELGGIGPSETEGRSPRFGMRSAAKNRPSITSWRGVNANCTCSSIPIGRLGLIRKGARRGNENRRQPMERDMVSINKISGVNRAGGRKNACATWKLWQPPPGRFIFKWQPLSHHVLRMKSSWRNCRTHRVMKQTLL